VGGARASIYNMDSSRPAQYNMDAMDHRAARVVIDGEKQTPQQKLSALSGFMANFQARTAPPADDKDRKSKRSRRSPSSSSSSSRRQGLTLVHLSAQRWRILWYIGGAVRGSLGGVRGCHGVLRGCFGGRHGLG